MAANGADWQRTLATLAPLDQVTAAPDFINPGSVWQLIPVDHFEQRTLGNHSRQTLLKLAALLLKLPEANSLRKTLRSLRVSNHAANLITRIVTCFEFLDYITTEADRENLRRIYRFFRDAGDAAADTIFLALAQHAGMHQDQNHDHYQHKARHILEQGLHYGVAPQRETRLMNGYDLMKHLDQPSGDWLVPMLEKIDEARAIGRLPAGRRLSIWQRSWKTVRFENYQDNAVTSPPEPEENMTRKIDELSNREQNTAVRFPKVVVSLLGQDGSAFAILGKVRPALKRAGIDDETLAEFQDEATSGDYDHLLASVLSWVTVD